MSNNPVEWESLTWSEIPEVLERSSHTVIFPLGATEQHGPHLGTGTDTAIASHLARAVSARTGVPILPPLAVGCSLGHSRRWPGTLSFSPRTLIAVVSEIGDWLAASGVRRLILLSSHVTNFAPLRCALEELRSRHDSLMVALVPTATLSPRVEAEFFADAADWHANAAETSLLLHLEPSWVRKERIAEADDPDRTSGHHFAHPVNRTSLNGVTGFPSRASAAEGARLFAMMTDDLETIVRNAQHENPPLSFSYHPQP